MSTHTIKTKQRAIDLIASGRTLHDVSNRTGVPTSTLHVWAAEAGVNRPSSEANRRYADDDRQRVFELYERYMSLAMIEDVTGIPSSTVRYWLDQEDMLRDPSEGQRIARTHPLYQQGQDRRRVIEPTVMLLHSGLSHAEAGKELGVAQSTVTRRANTDYGKRLRGAA